MKTMTISTALALALATASGAEGIKPVDPKPEPSQVFHVDNSTTVKNQQAQGQMQGQQQGQNQTATGGNGYGLGIGQGGAGGAGGHGGTGGSATSNATGGQGGAGGSVQNAGNSNNRNANSNRNDNRASARGGNQSQQATGGNVGNINVSNHQRQSAGSAYSANINGCGAKGGFSAGIQTFGWGVTAANCKEDLFAQVVAAEELYRSGRPAAAAYLAHTSNPARKALRDAGIVEDRTRQRRQSSSFSSSSIAQVEGTVTAHYRTCELRDGVPHILVKRGHDRDTAVRQCMSALGR